MDMGGGGGRERERGGGGKWNRRGCELPKGVIWRRMLSHAHLSELVVKILSVCPIQLQEPQTDVYLYTTDLNDK